MVTRILGLLIIIPFLIVMAFYDLTYCIFLSSVLVIGGIIQLIANKKRKAKADQFSGKCAACSEDMLP